MVLIQPTRRPSRAVLTNGVSGADSPWQGSIIRQVVLSYSFQTAHHTIDVAKRLPGRGDVAHLVNIGQEAPVVTIMGGSRLGDS